jgi:hypothetical protein
MTAAQYKLARRRRGTSAAVAVKLGVHRYTIDKRERGANPVTREAMLALLALPLASRIAPVPKRGRPKDNKNKSLL